MKENKGSFLRIGFEEGEIKMKKSVILTTDGALCPKCKRVMRRMKHHDNWRPRPEQPFWFEYWDKCPAGHHLQHYEAAKRFASWYKPGEKKPEPEKKQYDLLTKEYKDIVG